MPDPVVVVEEAPMPVIAETRTAKIVDNLFGNEPPEEEIVEEVVEEEVEEKEEVVEEKDDDAEEDYEAPLPTKKKKEKEEEEILHESEARKQAKEKGREAKRLAQENAELKLERDRLAQEKEEAAKRLAEIEAVRVKPTEHPDFVALQGEVLSDVNASARRLRGEAKVLFPKNFGVLMDAYLESTVAENVIEADAKLHSLIIDRLKLSEIPADEMTDEEREEFRPTIERVVDVMERNLGKTKALQDLHDKLQSRAKNGHLTASVREYENQANDFKPILDAIGELPDEVVETDPHSIEAVVTKMTRESPEAAKRLASAKRDVLEVIIGPKPLSQADIDRLEANGTDIKSFLVERQKAHREKQKRLIGMFAQALVTRPLFKQIHAEWSTLKGHKESEESEFDALRSTTKRKPPVVQKSEKRTTDAVLSKLFGDEED